MTDPAASPAFSRLEPDDRRRQILTAAHGVFAQRPFGTVAVLDIAAAAGVSRGLIHHYFGGKQEVFRAVVEDLAEQVPRLVRLDRGLPIDVAVSRNVDDLLDFMQEHRELALLIGANGPSLGDPALDRVVEAARERLIERIVRNHLGAEVAPPAARFLLRGYLGLVDAAAREWLGQARATREQVHTLLVSGVLALMRDTLPALMVLG